MKYQKLEDVDPALLRMLAANGYGDFRVVDGILCGIQEYATTRAIVCDLHEHGYEHRYCYQDRREANASLFAWEDGQEFAPGNWIKLKGRKDGKVFDDLNPKWSKS